MEPDEIIERTESGFKLTIEHTRGTGTRDEDEVTARAKTNTLDELIEMRSALIAETVETMDELRAHKPDEAE